MDYQVIITNRASKDLENIYDYIEDKFSTVQAQKVLEQLFEMIDSLDFMPERFRYIYIQELALKGVRQMVVRPYSVLYKILDRKVYILNVFHNSMDIENRIKE